ncbi:MULTISPECIES: hypothetical protein [Ramlibacter]|uniref:Uncharacterized protein n=1 Tax=Ramlibacter pinisoli TaxID=2682844 RepID=A0A6N8J1B7_9BURK|nr:MULTISPECIES: hypothetical protein [Ramlibacter]MBA2962130.1 hypothetical protein [Ramlibacter sp. CGMCC 1.13660]MVQ32073.1 hypothetical protein [Ramlibacter pinisoli]
MSAVSWARDCAVRIEHSHPMDPNEAPIALPWTVELLPLSGDGPRQRFQEASEAAVVERLSALLAAAQPL